MKEEEKKKNTTHKHSKDRQLKLHRNNLTAEIAGGMQIFIAEAKHNLP